VIVGGGEPRNERGATIVMVAFMLVALTAIAATVVDLAAARADRASNQIAADAAATAAADVIGDAGGDGACQAAVGYLEDASGQTVSGLNCGAFPHSCTESTASVVAEGTAGSLTVEFVHPVPDASGLMAPGALGAESQPIVAADGDPCDRFGVRIVETHTAFFGHVVGTDELTTSIHAVAMNGAGPDEGRVLNLLLLEREDCDVLSVSGGAGGAGGIIVGPYLDDETGETIPGRISVDSDGSGSCKSKGVINTDGNTATIRADGEAGCADELPAAPGAGCGRIEIVAAGSGDCGYPACTSTGMVAPNPITSSSPLTRASIDWLYNCKASYPTELDIHACPDASSPTAYIDNLVADVDTSGRPTGFQSYSDASYPCTIKNNEDVDVDVGNWFVDCDLTIGGNLTFPGGNIVFDGDVKMSGQSTLAFNTANTGIFDWVGKSFYDIRDSSSQAAFVYLRDGTLSKGSKSVLELDNVMMYVSDSSSLDVGDGSGSVSWTAPMTGPFEDLLTWSESTEEHKFAGGTSLELEGVFFAPKATFVYTGNSTQQQVSAQFITKKLSTNGGGLLDIRPIASRAVAFPENQGTLIR